MNSPSEQAVAVRGYAGHEVCTIAKSESENAGRRLERRKGQQQQMRKFRMQFRRLKDDQHDDDCSSEEEEQQQETSNTESVLP